MKIGLCGAPGAKKSELAAALAEHFQGIRIIDDYVPEVANKTKLALGFESSYLGNLYVAMERIARERKIDHMKRAKGRITCGTLFETAAYSAQDCERQLYFSNGDAETADTLKRVEAVMKMFACLFVDTYHYDHVFYLPVVSDDPDLKALDKNIQTAFEAFFLQPVTALIDPETRLQDVLRIIKEKDDERAAASPGLSD